MVAVAAVAVMVAVGAVPAVATVAAVAAEAAVAAVAACCTMVEYSTHYYKIEGSNPTTGTGREGFNKIVGIKPLVALIREKMFAELSWFKFLKDYIKKFSEV